MPGRTRRGTPKSTKDTAKQPRTQEPRRSSDAALELLRAAVESLGEGFLLCDADDRIRLYNQRYAENVHPKPAKGQQYEDFLRAQVSLRQFPAAVGREEAWIAERLANRRVAREATEIQVGNRWFQVKDRRLADGATVTVGFEITERKRTETALAKSESQLRAIVDQAAVGIALREIDGRWVEVNQKLCDILGYTREELLATTSVELTPPDERKVAIDYNQRMLRGEITSYAREKRYLRKDGTSVWVDLVVNVARNPEGPPTHTVTVIEDISARKTAELRARVADERLRSALENLGEMICLTDAEDRIVLCNRHFVAFNAPVVEFVAPGRYYEEHVRAGIARGLFPDAAGREEDWLAERMANRRNPRGPVERRRQDGRWLMVDDQILPDGGVVSFGIEITARKHAEEALRDVNAELERRVGERTVALETAYRELESFSYSVSHDLRAPLRAISGYSNILRMEEGDKLSAQGHRYLMAMDENAKRMGRLTDALLSLMRTSRRALSRASLDMASLARTVSAELSMESPAARIEIGPLPPASGDETLVRQVFSNLIGNALKYSAGNSAPEVEIGVEDESQPPIYYVRDNGVGFEMAHAGKLFQPFERLHSEREFPGTGIGLALAHLIVQRHGGRIWAESAPGKGAIFRFSLEPAQL